MYAINRIFVPGIFQGRNKKRNYFEGWYFKITDAFAANSVAFIPGVSYGKDEEDRHAFIQVLDMARNRSEYYSFDLSEFKFSEDKFEISIGKNLFTTAGMILSLDNGTSRYSGKLVFSKSVRLPRSMLSPGIMGPFSWIPFMECYHDTVSIRNTLSGTLETEDGVTWFTGGTGYIEKDWGSSFPKSWIWLQCNHFDAPGASFMLSYARIPFMGTSFRGLISYVRTESAFFRMATYNGARVTSTEIGKNELYLIAENRSQALNVRVSLEEGYNLKAPKRGLMDTDLTESLSSGIDVTMIKKKGKMLFQGKGRVAGVEIGGEIQDLLV